MKKIVLILIVSIAVIANAQHKKIIYGFDKIPQNLVINPGSETTYKYHIGVPLVSGFSAHSNISGITIADVIGDDSVGIFEGKEFNVKFAEAVEKLDNDDYAYFNTQIEILNAGYKINTRDYISGGFYLETDVFSTLPKEVLKLANEGNKNLLGKNINLNSIGIQAETVGVLHFGLSRRINNRLTLGSRLKFYFGGTNISSIRNRGVFRTELIGSKYTNSIKNLDSSIKTSRVYNEKGEIQFDKEKPFKGTLFGGNYGFGADFGFTYHINKQLEVSGSLLDFGFINYAKDVKKTTYKGDYSFNGANIDFINTSNDYWQELKNDIDKKLKEDYNNNPYTIARPMKGYIAYSYSFGKSLNRANCHDNTYKDFYDNTTGIQLFAVSQPNGLNLAYTAFYQRKLSKRINLKATYTIDDFSYSNFGLGMSLNIWRINLYGSIGNILGVTDTANTHTSSAQIGLNYIMN